jgi:hypothetical protein
MSGRATPRNPRWRWLVSRGVNVDWTKNHLHLIAWDQEFRAFGAPRYVFLSQRGAWGNAARSLIDLHIRKCRSRYGHAVRRRWRLVKKGI